MTQVFEWKRRAGKDQWQNPVLETVEVVGGVRGYQVAEEHEVTDANGVKRPAKGTIYLADVYGISTADELWYDGASVGELVRLEEYRDEAGPYGSVLHYG